MDAGLEQLLQLDGNKAVLAVGAVVGHEIQMVTGLLELVFENDDVLVAEADDDVGLDLYAQFFDLGDFACHDALLRKPELGDAVDQYAARLVQRLEDFHSVAQFRKVACAGQPGRAAADDGDLVPVAGCGLCRGGAVFELPVADEAFEFADGDRFAFDAQDAGAFALAHLRAANCRRR